MGEPTHKDTKDHESRQYLRHERGYPHSKSNKKMKTMLDKCQAAKSSANGSTSEVLPEDEEDLKVIAAARLKFGTDIALSMPCVTEGGRPKATRCQSCGQIRLKIFPTPLPGWSEVGEWWTHKVSGPQDQTVSGWEHGYACARGTKTKQLQNGRKNMPSCRKHTDNRESWK